MTCNLQLLISQQYLFWFQFDVVPPDSASVSSLGKKMAGDEPIKKKTPAAVKISPWALARLNAEEVSKAASEARKKSKILQPVVRRGMQFNLDSSFRSSSGRHIVSKADNSRRRNSKRIRLPAELPPLEPLTKVSNENESSLTSLAPLQLEPGALSERPAMLLLLLPKAVRTHPTVSTRSA